jgi:putative ABC transport system permease protein
MLRATLKDLRARKLRLVTTSIAVVLGVAFMAGTLVLTDTIGHTFESLFADVNTGTDALVRSEAAFSDRQGGAQRARLDAGILDTVRGVEGVAAAEASIQAYAQLVDGDGKPVGNPASGAPTIGGNWIDDDDLNPFELDSGRAPEAGDEVVIDRGSAKKAGFSVGDTATVLTQAGERPVTVVGIATFGGTDGPGGASVTLFTEEAAEAYLTAPGKIDAVKVTAAQGVSDERLAERIAEVLPAQVEVLTGAELTAEDQDTIQDGLGFFNTFLMSFAVIALFVGSFIIYNSFSILVAQRTRDMALLRAIGASRGQVLGSVLLEAVAVGVIASVLGLVAGVGMAALLRSLLSAMGIDLPAGDLVLSAKTVVVSVVAGLGVSVVSALFPARRAAGVPPVAALREVAADTSAGSRRRIGAGAGVTALGAAAITAGLFADAGVAMVGLGAAVVFVGVAILGPVLARPLSRVLGAPLPRLKGMAGTLARENAMRNPKRTSVTAAALMIGVALVGAITILSSSTKASIRSAVEESFTGDLVVDSGSSAGSGGFSPELAAQLNGLGEVQAAAAIRLAEAEVEGSIREVQGIDPTRAEAVLDYGVRDGSLTALGATQIAVQQDMADKHHWSVGDAITVRFAETGDQELTIASIFEEKDLGGDYVIGLDAFEANVADQLDAKVYVQLAGGVDEAAGAAAVRDVAAGYPQAEVQDRADFVAAQTKQIDQLLNLIYALLALAVVIALLGIANTLALSIFERTRELGLLRAVGMTRGQLRAMVRWESVIIALLGTALGLLIGTSFGWVLVQALADQGLSRFTVPVGQLAVLVVIAAMAGVAAAVLPARRAARLDVLAAITEV